MKYELTNETIIHFGRKLYRIKALKDFGDVKAGDLGGWVESEDNLSQEGNCWIFSNGIVFDNGIVSDNGEVWDNGEVRDNGIVCGYGRVSENGVVKSNGVVKGNGVVSKNSILTKTIINLVGLTWDVSISDNNITIGCNTYSKEKWKNFTDEEIDDMNYRALRFWKEYKDSILKLARV